MIIYRIDNKLTGDFYIGKSKFTAEERWIKHQYDMHHAKTKSRLYNAVRKYGVESFTPYEIEQTTAEHVNDREKYWIEVLDPPYNIAKGGNGGLIGTGQLGRTWKIKDTSRMKGKKTITPKVLEGRTKLSGANNYQSKYVIHTPWGIYYTWKAAIQGAAQDNAIPCIANAATLQKYCMQDIILQGQRVPSPWRGQSTLSLGFFVEKKDG